MATQRASDRLDITKIGIGNLIKNGHLTLPPHQREYAWKDEHVTELYKDFADAIYADEPDYFLGSVVVARDGSDLDVFDGQQRLATTVILLGAIRDYCSETGDKGRASTIESAYLKDKSFRTQEDLPNLRLGVRDHDYFSKKILDSDPAVQARSESHRRIEKAHSLARRHVRDIVAGQSPEKVSDVLSDWLDFLNERATVICVQVPDDSNAYVVFETMNDRGLRPSAADLLKNYLFGRAGDRLDEVEAGWMSMVGALDTVPDSDDDVVLTYIRHCWIAQHGPTRTKKLFEMVKKEVRSKASAVKLIHSLDATAPSYAALLNPSHDVWNPYGPSAKKSIATLRLLGAEQVRPMLLAAMGKFSTQRMNRLLRSAVCWTVRTLIVGTSGSGNLETAYGRCAAKIHDGEITDVDGMIKTLSNSLPTDSVFEAAIKDARVSKAHLANYYLRALQQTHDGEEEPQYVPSDDGSVNLEHVLPVSFTSSWGVDKEIWASYSKRLGNIVLLQRTSNSAIGNKPYAEKKGVLNSSAYTLTQLAAQHESWGPQEIEERQATLATLAIQTWPLTLG